VTFIGVPVDLAEQVPRCGVAWARVTGFVHDSGLIISLEQFLWWEALFSADAAREVVVEDLQVWPGEVVSGDAFIDDEEPFEEALVDVASAFVIGDAVRDVEVCEFVDGVIEVGAHLFVLGGAGFDRPLGGGLFAGDPFLSSRIRSAGTASA